MLFHEALAHSLVDERLRDGRVRRLAEEARDRARKAHELELQRVRASVLRLDRSSGEAVREV